MELDTFSHLLGWCTVINTGILVLSSVLAGLLGPSVATLHARLFGLDARTLQGTYFQFLGNYKLLIIVFNLVPWIALKILR